MNLKNKSILIFLLIAIIPISTVSLVSLNISQDLLQKSIGRNFKHIAHEESHSIATLLTEKILGAHILAESSQIKEAVKKSNLKYAGKSHDTVLKTINKIDEEWVQSKGQTDIANQLLKNDLSMYFKKLVKQSDNSIGEIFLTDIKGATVATSKRLTDYYQGDEYWWEYSFNDGNGNDFLDDRGFDESVKTLILGVVVPVKYEGKVIGILKMNNKAQEILNVIDRTDDEREHSVLIRSQGDIIAVSYNKKHSISDIEKNILATDEQVGWIEDIHQDGLTLIGYSPIDSKIFRRVPTPGEIKGVSGEKWEPTKWYLFIEVDHAKVFAPLIFLRTSLFICGASALVISLILAVLFVKPILRSISKLKKAVRTVGKGNLEYKVDVKSNDEMGELAASFNQMAENLSEVTASRDELEEEITERKRLEKDIINVSENEKKRIGRDLHDGIGQQLAGIGFMSKTLEHILEEKLPQQAAGASEITKLINEAMDEVRNMAKGLYPVDLVSNNLPVAMRKLAENTQKVSFMNCAFECNGAADVIDSTVAVNLYRITQEAVTNAIKHGKAKNIDIELFLDKGKSLLSVKNDGLDFSENTSTGKGLGLRLMEYRAEEISGSIDIRRGDKGGTVLTCEFPCK